jgi:hypothetical protein
MIDIVLKSRRPAKFTPTIPLTHTPKQTQVSHESQVGKGPLVQEPLRRHKFIQNLVASFKHKHGEQVQWKNKSDEEAVGANLVIMGMTTSYTKLGKEDIEEWNKAGDTYVPKLLFVKSLDTNKSCFCRLDQVWSGA